jgi:hypothetical protein
MPCAIINNEKERYRANEKNGHVFVYLFFFLKKKEKGALKAVIPLPNMCTQKKKKRKSDCLYIYIFPPFIFISFFLSLSFFSPFFLYLISSFIYPPFFYFPLPLAFLFLFIPFLYLNHSYFIYNQIA